MTNQPRRLSRRQLLKGSAILGAGAALAACAAPAAPAAQKPADAAKTPEAQVRAALADAIKRLDDGDARGF